MALLNLLLLPVLVALGLFKTGAPSGGDGAPAASGSGSGDGAGDSAAAGAGGGTEGTPATGTPGTADQGAQPPAAGSKPDPGPAGGVEALRADLAGERDKRQAAEAELEQLRNANRTEAEKAVANAKKAAETEADQRWAVRVIRSEAKSALAAAGATDVGVAVAAFLDEHRNLKVTDQGDVEELAAKVKSFTGAHPTLFTARVPSGHGDGGAGAPPPPKAAGSLEEALDRHYRQQQPQH